MSLTLLTLNIEGDKHLDRFLPKLKELQPQVICFQEMFKADSNRVATELGMNSICYVPTMKVKKENKYNINPRGNWGISIMTNLEVNNWETFYYRDFTELVVFEEPNDSTPAVIVATVSDGQQQYRVATTHFTWSPGGQTTDLQRQDFGRLKERLSKYEDIILCGDFNAPRGREMFSLFETLYTDNVPKEVTTTIDSSLHYAGDLQLQLVVDTIFSTPQYSVKDVQVISGVSDHMGVYGVVEKL